MAEIAHPAAEVRIADLDLQGYSLSERLHGIALMQDPVRAEIVRFAAQEIDRLRKALSGLESMYSRTWDRVDGALVMLPDSIPLFETAHKEARAALGIPFVEVDDE